MLALVRLAAWFLIAALAFATLSPIGLRPELFESAMLERALAYALLGFTLALAYPRRWLWALAACVMLAGLLEAGQLLVHSRHGRFSDFDVKAVAAILGCLSARLLFVLYQRTVRPDAPPRA